MCPQLGPTCVNELRNYWELVTIPVDSDFKFQLSSFNAFDASHFMISKDPVGFICGFSKPVPVPFSRYSGPMQIELIMECQECE